MLPKISTVGRQYTNDAYTNNAMFAIRIEQFQFVVSFYIFLIKL